MNSERYARPIRFGRYDIVEHLASGGMAQIYKASSSGNRALILKKIHSDYSQNQDFIRMFLEEAKISLALKHPHIVRVLDFGQLENSYYLAMEYVFGQDLGSLLKKSLEKKVHIPIDVACHMIYQCCLGLQYAHHLSDGFGSSVSIVHRDISPPNLLVSYNGEAKILDFGIAKAVSAVTHRNTRSGVLKGKFCYMSPEQARGEHLNGQSDIFSLGIVFHELLTSRSLFYSPDEIQTLERVRAAKAPPPSKFRKGLPKALDKIVLQALKPKLGARYQNCGEMAESIQRFLQQHYPRTDARTVARLVRTLFPEDFKSRLPECQKDGWKDVFVSGGADDELILDRALDSPSVSGGRAVMRHHKINWHDRLFYDPKISRKFFRSLRLAGLLIGLLVSSLFFFRSDLGNKLWSHVDRMRQGDFSWAASATNHSPRSSSETTALPAEPGSFTYWIQQAEAAKGQGEYELAVTHFDRALRINSFESSIRVRRYFALLHSGKTQEACGWFQAQRELRAEDRLLAEALCQQSEGQVDRALVSYGDFIRRFPSDARVSEVKAVVKSLMESQN